MKRGAWIMAALVLGCHAVHTPTAPDLPVPVHPFFVVTASRYSVTEGEYVTLCAELQHGPAIIGTAWDIAADGTVDVRLTEPCFTTRFYFSGYITNNVQAIAEDGGIYAGSVTIFVAPR